MLWLKSFHIVFMTAWLAVLFMLPRLFVYHVETPELAHKLQLWERRTYLLGHVAFGLMFVFGVALLYQSMLMVPGYMKQGWLHTKITLVAVLFAYFIYCGRLMKTMASGRFPLSSKQLRLFNEVPALFLLLIVVLVVVKPF
jgi:protoporphyrinogen IX oxidase